ncbi:MAG TPA: SPOR domain-containing protein [Pseudomonadales bacterium]|nr:SPOR domain-containing protein [Pseudomonadales bacterium]
MKWIFWTLLIFCVAFFGYQQWAHMQETPVVPVVKSYQPPPQENVPSLKLVTELPPADRAMVQKPVDDGFEVPAAAAQSVPGAAPAAPAVSQPVEPAAPASPAVTSEPVKAEPKPAVKAEPVQPAPAVAAAAPSVQPVAKSEPASAAAAQPEAVPAPVVLSLCPAVGPFRAKDSADSWRNSLSASHFAAALREVQLDKNPQHWVLLPPFASRDAAQKKVVELLSKKIDAYVISEGEQRNAISLGLFDRIESAQAMQQRIKAAGYPAEIRPKPHKASEWWVKLVQPADPAKVREALQTKLVGNDEIRVDPTKCD